MERNIKRLKRAHRYELKILGKLTLDKGDEKESFICNTLNISLSGALVETGSPLPVGSLLKYSFSIPGFDIPVNLIGEIVRRDNGADKGLPRGDENTNERALNRYGIIFLNLKDEDKKAMESYLVRNKRLMEEREGSGPEEL